MSNAINDGRFAPPQAHVEDIVDKHGAVELASRGSRLGAVLIDGIIALGLFWLVSLVTPLNLLQSKSFGLTSFKPVTTISGIVLYLLVHGYLLATRGQSIGKILLKIRIVRTDGSPASFQRLAGLRYALPGLLQLIPALYMVYGLIDTFSIFRESRRCLHDLLADTVVIKA
jgi:uncharacterized RDD family membrane protein YckC